MDKKKVVENYAPETANLHAYDVSKWVTIEKVSSLLKIFHKTIVTLSQRSSIAFNIITRIKFLLPFFIKKCSSVNNFLDYAACVLLKECTNMRFYKYLNNIILGIFIDSRYIFSEKKD